MAKVLLFASLVFLFGCGDDLPKFPVTHPKYISTKGNVFECWFDENNKLVCDADLPKPISVAAKHYCIPLEDYQAVRSWVFNVEENYECKLKQKK